MRTLYLRSSALLTNFSPYSTVLLPTGTARISGIEDICFLRWLALPNTPPSSFQTCLAELSMEGSEACKVKESINRKMRLCSCLALCQSPVNIFHLEDPPIGLTCVSPSSCMPRPPSTPFQDLWRWPHWEIGSWRDVIQFRWGHLGSPWALIQWLKPF